MTFQLSTTLRNAKMNAYDTTVGSSATLKIFSGAEPANCAASDPSGLLCTITLPASPWAAASSGAIALSGTWSASASGTGTAASFRIYDGSSVCHVQGTVTATGGGGDMTVDNTSIASGQVVTVLTCTITAGNA
jgi:hypothetical protein